MLRYGLNPFKSYNSVMHSEEMKKKTAKKKIHEEQTLYKESVPTKMWKNKKGRLSYQLKLVLKQGICLSEINQVHKSFPVANTGNVRNWLAFNRKKEGMNGRVMYSYSHEQPISITT